MKGISNEQIFEQCQRLFDRNKKWEELRKSQIVEPLVKDM